jgi:hypothetical protein
MLRYIKGAIVAPTTSRGEAMAKQIEPTDRPGKPKAKARSRAVPPGSSRLASALTQSVLDTEPSTEEQRRARIARAAYFRAEQRRFEPGHEDEDWLAAEAQIATEDGNLQ